MCGAATPLPDTFPCLGAWTTLPLLYPFLLHALTILAFFLYNIVVLFSSLRKKLLLPRIDKYRCLVAMAPENFYLVPEICSFI
jgi:hypothetical protein